MKILKNKFAKIILIILAVPLLSVIVVGCSGKNGEKANHFRQVAGHTR